MGINTTYTAGTSNQYISMYLYVEESSYDVSSNTSEVIWEIGVRKSAASTASTWGNWSWTVSVNGAGGSGSLSGTVAPGGSLKFTSGSTTVTHNSDGTKTINCDAVIGGKESGELGVRTFQLTTIPRVSVPTLTAGTAQFGGSIGVMTNRKSESFSHRLYYSLNGGAEVGITDGILDGYTWNIPKDLMNQIPSATSASITLRLYTFSGGVNLGSNTVSFTATVPADVKPTISNAAWAAIAYDNSGTAASGIAAAVQGYSKAKVTFDKSKLNFPYSASLKSFSISYGGSSWSRTSNGTLSTGVLGSAGTASVTCTVTDTRGRTASASRTLSVNGYSKPTLKSVTIARATEGGDESSSGTYLLLKATAQVASIKPGGTELNPTAVFRGEYKVTTAGTYVTGPDLVSGEQTVYAASLDVTKSYTARIVLQDTLGNQTSAAVIIPTDAITFFLKDGGKAVSFGKYAEADEVVESAWTMKAPDFEVGKVDGGIWLTGSDGVQYRMHANGGALYLHRYLNGEVKEETFHATASELSTSRALSTGGKLSAKAFTLNGNAVNDVIVAQGRSGRWYYWKWASKLAICVHDSIFTDNFGGTTWGTMYDSPEIIFDAYPFAFASAPAVFAGRTGADSSDYNTRYVWLAMTGGTTTNPPKFDMVRATNVVIGHPQLSMTAIGRWA